MTEPNKNPKNHDPEEGSSTTPLRSALPSRRARWLAFLAICVAGFCGGLIGFAYQDIQCEEDCGTSIGLYILGGSLVASIGVAIISVLVLRAMEEWQGEIATQNKHRSRYRRK